MKKGKRILCNIGITLLVLLLLATGGYYILYQHQAYGIVGSANSNARNHYNLLTSDLVSLPELPENCMIYGECHDFWDYVVYADAFIPENTVLCGTAPEVPNCFWAARIQNGSITEVWSANYSLSEEQLRSYTHEEQQKQIRFPEKFAKSRLIGYYTAS